MRIHWTFRHCNGDKEKARSYLEKKKRRLTRRIARFRSDRCSLELTLYNHAAREAWELRAVLRTPTGSLVATGERHDLYHVIDEILDELTRQLRRHKAKVRKEHVTRRRRQRALEFAKAEPFLKQDVHDERRDDFFELLSPLLETVREHAAYELDILETEGDLPIGELSADDLVDEVLLLAYDRYRLRPPEFLMESWLMGLLQERLNELSAQEPPISLAPDAEVTLPEEQDADALDFEDVKYWMSHVMDFEDTVGLEELVPDEDVADTISDIEQKEEKQQLKQMLNKLPKRQRQAIMLHEASGFEVHEIASMLQMSDAEIERLIEKARATLHKHLGSFRSNTTRKKT